MIAFTQGAQVHIRVHLHRVDCRIWQILRLGEEGGTFDALFTPRRQSWFFEIIKSMSRQCI